MLGSPWNGPCSVQRGNYGKCCGCGVAEDALEALWQREHFQLCQVLGSAALCLALAPSDDASTSWGTHLQESGMFICLLGVFFIFLCMWETSEFHLGTSFRGAAQLWRGLLSKHQQSQLSGDISKNIRQLWFEQQPLMCLRQVDAMTDGVEESLRRLCVRVPLVWSVVDGSGSAQRKFDQLFSKGLGLSCLRAGKPLPLQLGGVGCYLSTLALHRLFLVSFWEMNSQSEENMVINQIHTHPAYDSGCNQIQLGMFQSIRDAKSSVLSGMNFLDTFRFYR